MIKTKEEMRNETRENVRGGIGALQFINVFEPDETFEKCRMCSVVTFEPGMSIGEHPHGPDAEMYFILEGELTVVDNGVTKILKEGEAAITGGGNSHSVANRSDKTAKMLAVVIR